MKEQEESRRSRSGWYSLPRTPTGTQRPPGRIGRKADHYAPFVDRCPVAWTSPSKVISRSFRHLSVSRVSNEGMENMEVERAPPPASVVRELETQVPSDERIDIGGSWRADRRWQDADGRIHIGELDRHPARPARLVWPWDEQSTGRPIMGLVKSPFGSNSSQIHPMERRLAPIHRRQSRNAAPAQLP
jgi:hypothetical protein